MAVKIAVLDISLHERKNKCSHKIFFLNLDLNHFFRISESFLYFLCNIVKIKSAQCWIYTVQSTIWIQFQISNGNHCVLFLSCNRGLSKKLREDILVKALNRHNIETVVYPLESLIKLGRRRREFKQLSFSVKKKSQTADYVWHIQSIF